MRTIKSGQRSGPVQQNGPIAGIVSVVWSSTTDFEDPGKIRLI